MVDEKAAKNRFKRCRAMTEALCASMSDADATVQSMADASPAKWHLAHTTWFFETFVLREHARNYSCFDEKYHFLFNSYYEAEGPRLARSARGLLTRPSLREIREYRSCVTEAVLTDFDLFSEEVLALIELGCHHEEQHQELLLTDALNLFSHNPLNLSMWPPGAQVLDTQVAPVSWVQGRSGVVDVGYDGKGFAFDSETPRHKVWLADHVIGNRLITNVEWLEFMESGGYTSPSHWLSDGWAWVQQNRVDSPLYWRRDRHGEWGRQFGLTGNSKLMPFEPVCHISLFEADAYARWAGARLPTEMEWEDAARDMDPAQGNFLDAAGPSGPRAAGASTAMHQMFGDVWEWTGSAFLPYPGFATAAGAVGEYNGKFMSGQFVLKGGSCATPRGHMRASYRNFFYPHQRWQFTGLRLAKDKKC